jgi:uncharacterized protein YtpQ (UPF0354 family)
MSLTPLKSTVVPQFFPAHWLTDAPDIVFSDFPSRIRIGYVLRENGAYSYVMREQLQESGLSLHALHESALENLRKLAFPRLCLAKTPGGPEAWLSDTEDNFNAARILLPNVQKAIAADLGEPFLVILPCRDWFVAWSTTQGPEWQEKNRAEALRIFREDDYNLTPDVFQFQGERFSVSDTQPPDA